MDKFCTLKPYSAEWILVIGQLSSSNTIAFWTRKVSKSTVAYIFLLYLDCLISFSTISYQFLKISTAFLKSSWSIYIPDIIFFSTNSSIRVLTQQVIVFLGYTKSYLIQSLSNSRIVVYKAFFIPGLYLFACLTYFQINTNFS